METPNTTPKIPILELPFKKLPIPDSWIEQIEKYVKAEVNLKGKIDAGGEIKVEETDKKWAGKDTWEEGKMLVNPAAIRIKGELGVEAEISITKDLPLFSIGGFASGMTKPEIFAAGYFKDHWDIVWFREGIPLELAAGGWITISGIKYEIDPIYKKMQVIP